MKYLFTSLHLDPNGEKIFIEQTPEDKSTIDSLRSAFFDVLEQERAGNPCQMFCLTGEGHNYLVDLRDGRFEIDGTSFYLHTGEIHNIRLIYFRKVNRFFSMDYESQEQMIESYNFGWQATVDGKNVQHVITLK
jgi:hypothetical protein